MKLISTIATIVSIIALIHSFSPVLTLKPFSMKFQTPVMGFGVMSVVFGMALIMYSVVKTAKKEAKDELLHELMEFSKKQKEQSKIN